MKTPCDSSTQNCDSCGNQAEVRNRDCFCKTFDATMLQNILGNTEILRNYSAMFSNTAVFISAAQLNAMRELISAIERVFALPAYLQDVINRSADLSRINPGTAGVFMGYDFHMSAEGPKLIEINTNAGGAFLNAILANSQIDCCYSDANLLNADKQHLDQKFVDMFLQEWKSQRGDQPLNNIAIVDEHPEQQFLYPEFKIAQQLFEAHQIKAFILAPEDLMLKNGKLCYRDQPIDFIYNRLTDFSLKNHPAILSAYQENAVVLTPSPRHHAVYADKRNLIILSDPQRLADYGADEKDIIQLQSGVPKTVLVSAQNADALWAQRKKLFFKPAQGFGSRAAYRGEKLTKGVWQEILQGEYIAQELVVPSERGVQVDDVKTSLKMDLRAYVYRGEIQLLAARLYQGQTTNFRTAGGGFAPVFISR